MAANLLETLKQEITCPLCLDIFKQPKKLPCEHVYCKECLQSLVARRTAGSFTCPECRKPVEVSSPDLGHFSTAYHINRLIEMYEKGTQEAERSADSVTARSGASVDSFPRRGGCEAHRSQSLSLYCETCKKLVCRDCILFSCANHSYGYIEDKCEEQKLALEGKLYPVKQLHLCVTEALQATQALERELSSEEERVMQELETSFQELFDVLKEEKHVLEGNVKSKFKDTRMHHSLIKQDVQRVCTRLETVLKTIHHHESPVSFLTGAEAREHIIQEATKSAQNMESPYSTKIPNIGLSVLGASKLKEVCKGRIYHFLKDDPLRCHFDRMDWDNIPLTSTTSVTLHLETFFTPKLEAMLHCTYTKENHHVDVVSKSPQSFALMIRPQARGRHELHIKYNNAHISGSPLQLYVVPNISKLLPKSESNGLRLPMGIKYSGGRVYVSELGCGLTVLEPRTLAKLSSVWMPDIWEFLVDVESERIYGTDSRQNTVKMMNLRGETLKTIGRGNLATPQFHCPNGIRWNKSKDIVVCDTMNNRLQVLDRDLNLLYMIKHSSFAMPDDLDFDEEGNLYVANQTSHTIGVFTSEGAFLRVIGSYGSRPGELDNPISVAVYRNLVYVTDSGNGRISVFTTAGEFVTTFGKGFLTKPECVAVDEDGYLYVSDGRQKIYIF